MLIGVSMTSQQEPQLAQRHTNEANVHLVKTGVLDLQGEEKCTS